MSFSETLMPFGFTALESEIYVFLLKLSPATGYRIAQGINKPAANTYKAIQALQAKGAILVEDGPSRLCRAIPLDELMNRLQKDFEARRKSAEKQLKAVGKPQEDGRIYQLVSKDQILNRVREMFASASDSILFKLPTEALHAVEGDIEKAVEKGVRVYGLSNEAMAVEGAEVLAESDLLPNAVTVVSDASQVMTGIVSSDGDSDAIWTRNETLARSSFVSLSAEFALAQVSALLAADEKRGRMIRAIEGRPKLP